MEAKNRPKAGGFLSIAGEPARVSAEDQIIHILTRRSVDSGIHIMVRHLPGLLSQVMYKSVYAKQGARCAETRWAALFFCAAPPGKEYGI